MSKFAIYAKALLAALIAGLGTLKVSLNEGGVSGSESVDILTTVLVGLSVVWAVPNAKAVVADVPIVGKLLAGNKD